MSLLFSRQQQRKERDKRRFRVIDKIMKDGQTFRHLGFISGLRPSDLSPLMKSKWWNVWPYFVLLSITLYLRLSFSFLCCCLNKIKSLMESFVSTCYFQKFGICLQESTVKNDFLKENVTHPVNKSFGRQVGHSWRNVVTHSYKNLADVGSFKGEMIDLVHTNYKHISSCQDHCPCICQLSIAHINKWIRSAY